MINPKNSANLREKKLEDILAMTFDPIAKAELEKIVEEIRGLKQRVARLEMRKGRVHRALVQRTAVTTLQLDRRS